MAMIFLDMSPKTQHKKKNKRDYTKFKGSAKPKKQHGKAAYRMQESFCKPHISNKGLISKYIKNSYNSITKSNLIKK